MLDLGNAVYICSVALLHREKMEKSKSDTDSEFLLYYYIMKGKSTLILLTYSSGSHMVTQLWVRTKILFDTSAPVLPFHEESIVLLNMKQ